MRRLALPLAFAAALAAALATCPAAALERYVGSVPRGYARDGRAYYPPISYGRARIETHSSSATFRGFSLRRTVTEAEAEIGYGRLPPGEQLPPAPPSACGGGGWEVVNAAPGEPTCVGRPRR